MVWQDSTGEEWKPDVWDAAHRFEGEDEEERWFREFQAAVDGFRSALADFARAVDRQAEIMGQMRDRYVVERLLQELAVDHRSEGEDG